MSPTIETAEPAAAADNSDTAGVRAAMTRVETVLVDTARALGLTVVAEARWPESGHDHTAPPLPGFIVSSFSPIAAETAARCMKRRPATSGTAIAVDSATSAATTGEPVTAVLIASSLGDVESAIHVARAVDTAGRVGPLLFFQSVPNAVAGHIAARWHLTGPVVCVATLETALEAAALLIEDGDADEALVVHVERVVSEDVRDQARAVLLRATPRHQEGGQP
jgi:3-oxoacyl-(acyl-carrier-protein) synthase